MNTENEKGAPFDEPTTPFEKAIKEVAEETAWLDKAEEYAISQGIIHLDFSSINDWKQYYNKGISPEEAVEDLFM